MLKAINLGGGSSGSGISSVTNAQMLALSATDGQIVYNTTFLGLYTYTNSHWSPLGPRDPSKGTLLYDEFNWETNAAPRGDFAWIRYASGANASHADVAPLSSETNRYGIHQVAPSTDVSVAGGWYSQNGRSVYPGGTTLVFAYAIQVGKASDATDDWVFLGGFQDFIGVLVANGVYFLFDRSVSANWQARTRASSVNTTADTGVAVSTAWTNFRIEINASWTSVAYYINGTLVATNTSNIPSAIAVGPQLYMYRVAGIAASTNFKCDWAYLNIANSSARGTF